MIKTKSVQVGFSDWLRVSLLRASRAHFLLLAVYAVVIIFYDAAKVITAEAVLQRWIAAGALLMICAVIWYLAHNQTLSLSTLKKLTFALILSDIGMAAFNIYTQRGMASRAVLLFIIPIVVSAILLNRAAILATAALSAGAYIVTAVAYFTLNFNEGYKTELYGEVGFYAAMFFVVAILLSVLVRFGGSTNDT